MAKKKTKPNLICSHCIGEFDVKEMNVAMVPNREYSTVYCSNCIKELGIEKFEPYVKPRKNAKKPATTKKNAKKPTVKRTTKKEK